MSDPAAAAGCFAGQHVCISGKFATSQADMKAIITKNGGKLVDSVNRACTVLVTTPDALGSTKSLTAHKFHVPIVTDAWIHACVKAGRVLLGEESPYALSAEGVKRQKPPVPKKAQKQAQQQEQEQDATEASEPVAAPASKKPAAGISPKAAAAPAKKAGSTKKPLASAKRKPEAAAPTSATPAAGRKRAKQASS